MITLDFERKKIIKTVQIFCCACFYNYYILLINLNCSAFTKDHVCLHSVFPEETLSKKRLLVFKCM